MNLQGKKALVFGGTSGIGLATIKMLQSAGATVVAISRNPEKAGDLQGVELQACDVRDEAALTELFAAQAPYDVLISAATGGGGPSTGWSVPPPGSGRPQRSSLPNRYRPGCSRTTWCSRSTGLRL